MRNWHAILSILLPTCFLLVTPNPAQDRGMISGTVVDENAAPMSGARVNADPVDGRARGSLVRYVETDPSGHFRIDRLVWGSYRVFAKKEDAEYPDVRWSFYGNDAFPTVAISSTAPAADVRIKLGPKAGVLAGSITNALTAAPVNAGFKLIRAGEPNKWVSMSMPPDYRVLLPPATDVLLEVSARGFKSWTPGHPLRLAPGAEMHLDISLEPSHDPALHPSKFLVPQGYVGWLLLQHDVKGAEPTPIEAGTKIFKFPPTGSLNTSSSGPEKGAEDQYFYYSPDGSVREIPTNYRNGNGMIWGQYDGTRNGKMSQFGFFIGTEEQYKKSQTRMTHPGPIPNPQHQ